MGGLTIGLAFLGGLASFLSPCVLPLIPAYVGYLGGRSKSVNEGFSDNKTLTLLHGVAFIAGFSLVFIVLGIAVSAIGGYFLIFRNILAKIGGIIVLLFGLQMLGIINVPIMNYDLRFNYKTTINPGYISSFLMGVFFSAGWSPCIGPILGSIMMLVLNEGAIYSGVVLLSAYSLGLAVPFIIVALGVGSVTVWLRKFGKFSLYVGRISGVMLIVIGIMLLFGLFQKIAIMGSILNY
jgi:cytochrome c-type biogenesis protein